MNLSKINILRQQSSKHNHGKSMIKWCLISIFFTLLPASASALVFENTLAAQLEQNLAVKTKVNLTVSPEQCVAMQQGQNCYVAVELFWQAQVKDNYCLYSSTQQQPLQCWNDTLSGKLKKEFTTKNNLLFFLRKQNHQQAIATAKVKMAWVHKKKGKPRLSWRMF